MRKKVLFVRVREREIERKMSEFIGVCEGRDRNVEKKESAYREVRATMEKEEGARRR